MIAANAKWDIDFRIDEIVDLLLKSVADAKPITARECIKSLPGIAMFKPELLEDILVALRNADISIYSDSMRSLVSKDRLATIQKLKKLSK